MFPSPCAIFLGGEIENHQQRSAYKWETIWDWREKPSPTSYQTKTIFPGFFFWLKSPAATCGRHFFCLRRKKQFSEHLFVNGYSISDRECCSATPFDICAMWESPGSRVLLLDLLGILQRLFLEFLLTKIGKGRILVCWVAKSTRFPVHPRFCRMP